MALRNVDGTAPLVYTDAFAFLSPGFYFCQVLHLPINWRFRLQLRSDLGGLSRSGETAQLLHSFWAISYVVQRNRIKRLKVPGRQSICWKQPRAAQELLREWSQCVVEFIPKGSGGDGSSFSGAANVGLPSMAERFVT